MARTKVEPKKTAIKSWLEADLALGKIAQLQEKEKGIVSKHNKEEMERREKMHGITLPLQIEVQELALGLKEFCEANMHDLGKLKSKKLNNGTVSFRDGNYKVATLPKVTLKTVLERVQKSAIWSTLFVRTKEELDKEAILKSAALNKGDEGFISKEELLDLGVFIDQDKNVFGYEIKVAQETMQ